MITLRLQKSKEQPVKAGYPWIFAGDAFDSSEWRIAPAGSLVAIETHKGEFVGIGYLDPKSQITCRILTLKKESIDANFFAARFKTALALREKIVGVPYYRLVHAEADGIPGLIVDRFGGIAVAQPGNPGISALEPLWKEALLRVMPVSLAGGDIVEVHENGFVYYADLARGQKTGWYFDQRDNHKLLADMAAGKTLLDVFSHSGGFGLLAAKHGARQVTLVDSSSLALELAKKAAAKNGVSAEYIQGDAFEVMENLAQEGRRYDIVAVDPPPFVKNKKDIAAGMKGYAKMARLAAPLVAPGGHLFAASCSHHASRGAFNNAIMEGIEKAWRKGKIVKQTGAAADHPIHSKLPQSEYLKGILIRLD